MDKSEVRRLQTELRAAGHDIPVDGKMGPATEQALAAHRASQTAAKAASEGKKADAEAASARAREAEANAKIAATKAEEAAAQRDPMERAYHTGLQITGVAAGMAIGHKLANSIENRVVTTVAERNVQVTKLGNDAKATLNKGVGGGKKGAGQLRKLDGIVKAADKLNLGKIAGPLGAGKAAILIAEGLALRFGVGPQIENETAKEVINAAATGFMFAGGTLVGDRMIHNATPQALPNAKALGEIEKARAVVTNPATVEKAAAKAAKPAASVAGKVGSVALKALAPVAALFAAKDMFTSSAEAGDGTIVAGAKAVAAGVDSVVTFGALTAAYSDPKLQAEIARQQAQPRGARGSAPILTAKANAGGVGVGVGVAAIGAALLADANRRANKMTAHRGDAAIFAVEATAGSLLLGSGAIITMANGAKADDGFDPRSVTTPQPDDGLRVPPAVSIVGAGFGVFSAVTAKTNVGRVGWGAMAALNAAFAADTISNDARNANDRAAHPGKRSDVSGGSFKPAAAHGFDYAAFKNADARYKDGRAASREASAGQESDGVTDAHMRLNPHTGQMVQVGEFVTPRRIGF